MRTCPLCKSEAIYDKTEKLRVCDSCGYARKVSDEKKEIHYIFAWNEKPSGGLNDLISVCMDRKLAIEYAENAATEYRVVQVMNQSGVSIYRRKENGI